METCSWTSWGSLEGVLDFEPNSPIPCLFSYSLLSSGGNFFRQQGLPPFFCPYNMAKCSSSEVSLEPWSEGYHVLGLEAELMCSRHASCKWPASDTVGQQSQPLNSRSMLFYYNIDEMP